MPTDLYCATGNSAKLREFQQAAGDGFRIHPLPPAACPETGDTFEANAREKGLCYSRAVWQDKSMREKRGCWIFADDSGLEIDHLAGAPGIYSARYAGPGAGDAANNALVLQKLRGVRHEERTARFVCCIALAREREVIKTFRGEVSGYILTEPAGGGGFGYDPLFWAPQLRATFSEVTAKEKWRLSHRGTAFRRMIAWLCGDAEAAAGS